MLTSSSFKCAINTRQNNWQPIVIKDTDDHFMFIEQFITNLDCDYYVNKISEFVHTILNIEIDGCQSLVYEDHFYLQLNYEHKTYNIISCDSQLCLTVELLNVLNNNIYDINFTLCYIQENSISYKKLIKACTQQVAFNKSESGVYPSKLRNGYICKVIKSKKLTPEIIEYFDILLHKVYEKMNYRCY